VHFEKWHHHAAGRPWDLERIFTALFYKATAIVPEKNAAKECHKFKGAAPEARAVFLSSFLHFEFCHGALKKIKHGTWACERKK
jgi:hypothetical protein